MWTIKESISIGVYLLATLFHLDLIDRHEMRYYLYCSVKWTNFVCELSCCGRLLTYVQHITVDNQIVERFFHELVVENTIFSTFTWWNGWRYYFLHQLIWLKCKSISSDFSAFRNVANMEFGTHIPWKYAVCIELNAYGQYLLSFFRKGQN